MNSAIQTLFMTPEFRKSVYQWRYNPEIHGEKKTSIPYQLQKLFAELQLSKKDFVDTRDLTGSFGWHGNEGFVQQDVQEFFRVLFDAIEQSYEMAGESSEVIQNLYQGQQSSYVRCLECGNESGRQETFLDISLPIRNEFGTGVTNSSLEMALENYLKPDILEGDNQYECSTCQKRVNAKKGLKIDKTPQIVCICFNRFTLDYETFQRVKVTDRVSFPQILNMNDYMEGYEGIKDKLYDKEVQLVTQYNKKEVEKNLEKENKKHQALEQRQESRRAAQSKDEAGESQLMTKEDPQKPSADLVQESPGSNLVQNKNKVETGVQIKVGNVV